MRRTLIAFTSLLFLNACGRLDSIPTSPPQTPQSWLTIQPYLAFKIGLLEGIIIQPSTSIIVYLLWAGNRRCAGLQILGKHPGLETGLPQLLVKVIGLLFIFDWVAQEDLGQGGGHWTASFQVEYIIDQIQQPVNFHLVDMFNNPVYLN